jgi:hypothetical protein
MTLRKGRLVPKRVEMANMKSIFVAFAAVTAAATATPAFAEKQHEAVTPNAFIYAYMLSGTIESQVDYGRV